MGQWLEECGERHVLETATRASDADEVSKARWKLMSHFFEGYVPAARRAQAGATPIAEALGAREASVRRCGTPRRSSSRSLEAT